MTTREISIDELPASKRPVQTKPQEVNDRGILSQQYDTKVSVICAGKIVAGIIMIFFGLTSTGSFYTPASKFGGVLASIFYEWQVGTLVAIIGCILIYDSLKTFKFL